MSPRPYRLGQRQAAVDQTRSRILGAARELLTVSGGFTGFTVDAIARQAGVARMTVYYQFGSKQGLLEALFDDLAARGGMSRLPHAFEQAEPLDALAEFIAVFSSFWASDRLVIRRLHGLAALDPELEQVSREEWRRAGLRVILGRLAEKWGRPSPESFGETLDVIYTLTSFESFDSLACPGRGPEEVASLVYRLACVTAGVERPQGSGVGL